MSKLVELNNEQTRLEQRLAEIQSEKQQEKQRSQIEYQKQQIDSIREQSFTEWGELLEVAEKVNKLTDSLQTELEKLKSFKALHNNRSDYRLYLQGGLNCSSLPRLTVTGNSCALTVEPGKI